MNNESICRYAYTGTILVKLAFTLLPSFVLSPVAVSSFARTLLRKLAWHVCVAVLLSVFEPAPHPRSA